MLFLFHGSLLSVNAQHDQKFSFVFANHYSSNILTASQEEDQQGRYGFGLAFDYHFGDPNNFFHTSIGVAYNRIGYSRNFLWEDGTPELEALYGKLPNRNIEISLLSI